MMRLNKALALILAVSLLVLLPGFARAAQEFNIEAALFAGIFENTWNRMDVRVENKSTSDFQGSILVELQGEYLREVFVEAGKAVTLTLSLASHGFQFWQWIQPAQNLSSRSAGERGEPGNYHPGILHRRFFGSRGNGQGVQ